MRLIDADALIKALEVIQYNDIYDLSLTEDLIDNAPTVDAVVNTIDIRPQGKWIDSEAFKRKVYRCSLCNEVSLIPFYNFCPSCGADMREGGKA